MKKILNWFPDIIVLLVFVLCVVIMFDDLGIGLALLAFCLPAIVFIFLAINKLFHRFTGREVIKRRKLYKNILRIALPISVALIPAIVMVSDQFTGFIVFVFIVPIFFLMVFIAWVILTVFFSFDILKSIKVPAGLTIILLVSFYIASDKISDSLGKYQSENNSVMADIVIECLSDYKEDKGGYPASLDVLVPDYCPDIPLYLYGLSKKEFKYKPRDGEYYLFYDNRYGWNYNYYSASSTWSGK